MGTSAVSATSEAFCRWLHYQYTFTVVCLNGLVCSVCCRSAFVHRYHTVVQRLLCVSLQKHSRGGCTINMLPRLCVLEWPCLLCMLSVNRAGYCIRIVLHQVGTVSCCFSSRLCVCATSEAFYRWQHCQYTPTVVCTICKCQCIIIPV